MKILITANPENKESQRLAEAGEAAGHKMTVAPMRDVCFAQDEKMSVSVFGKEIAENFDCIYLRNMHPFISEGLMLAEFACSAGIKILDSALTEENFIQNKSYDAWKMSLAGIPVAQGVQVTYGSMPDKLTEVTRFPVVVKGIHGSQGERVHLCDDIDSINAVLEESPDMSFLIQDRLDIKNEYRVLTIGYESIGVIEKFAPSDDFRRNLSQGGTAQQTELNPSLTALCEKAARTLKREFAGVDLAILDDGSPVILEVNRSPGFCGFEEVTGMDVAGRFIEYLESQYLNG
jgi:RimK family alpha-L-glutamate ligase